MTLCCLVWIWSGPAALRAAYDDSQGDRCPFNLKFADAAESRVGHGLRSDEISALRQLLPSGWNTWLKLSEPS